MNRLVIGEEPGVVLEVRHLGAIAHRLLVTGVDGVRRNVVVGHTSDDDYRRGHDYRGAVVGRFANRIAGGRFELDGHTIRLATNEGGNTLHGGPDGFHRRSWELVDRERDRLRLRLVSPDGDQGFAGQLVAQVRYSVSADTLAIDIEATADAPTVANLTSHVYWNLDGSPAIDDHVLRVDADEYLPVDAVGIPTGERAPVAGTPYDLREGRAIGDRRIDHCYLLRGATTLEAGGHRLELTTNRPGLQVYTGDAMEGSPRAGIALEPQLFPDSPHHPEFPSAVLRPGEVSRTSIRVRFG